MAGEYPVPAVAVDVSTAISTVAGVDAASSALVPVSDAVGPCDRPADEKVDDEGGEDSSCDGTASSVEEVADAHRQGGREGELPPVHTRY